MKNKITLVTPPDFYENSSFSVLLINITDNDQETVTSWLSNSGIEDDLNLYYFNKDSDAKWLLSAVSKSDLVFFELDQICEVTAALSGYILSKSHVYYHTEYPSKSENIGLINSNRVPDVRFFLDEIFTESRK